MIRKFNLIWIFTVFQFTIINSSFATTQIVTYVEDEIITNYDILKEARYLKVLNPGLANLKEDQLSELAKQSLIKEIIKRKEILKIIEIKDEKSFVNEYLENLFTKLKFKDVTTFNDALLKNKNYSIKEIKSKIGIELYWNELIYTKYNNQLDIDKEKLSKKVENITNKKMREFFLSEIVFAKKNNDNLDDLISKIKMSINEIGFNNTANIFSISESAKLGGKVGWIKEETLSKKIYEKIKTLKINEYSEVLKLDNNFIILKVDEIREVESNIDKKKELQRLIQIERNKKLEKLSRIYFNKTKTNYLINEK